MFSVLVAISLRVGNASRLGFNMPSEHLGSLEFRLSTSFETVFFIFCVSLFYCISVLLYKRVVYVRVVSVYVSCFKRFVLLKYKVHRYRSSTPFAGILLGSARILYFENQREVLVVTILLSSAAIETWVVNREKGKLRNSEGKYSPVEPAARPAAEQRSRAGGGTRPAGVVGSAPCCAAPVPRRRA